MRSALAAFFLLLCTAAHADVAKDYAACLIGYAVIALGEQGDKKDAMAALATARPNCPEPAGLDPEDESSEDTFYLIEEIAEKVMTE
jgi:hypothetical protein